jgi:hypothetical protein
MRWYTIVALVFIVAAYTVIGGLVYSYLEHGNETKIRDEVLQQIDAYLDENPCINMSDLGEIQVLLKEMKNAGLRVDDTGTLVNSTRWDIRTAMFVALQLIATIGFPWAAPSSSGGRAFTVPYAIFGIPLFLATAIGMGTLLNRFAESLRILMVNKCCKGCALDCGATLFRTLVIALLGILFFMFIPSIIFKQIEPWTYGDAFYFSFITLATIGFGDLVPTYNDVPWMTDNYRNWYRLAVAFWILILSAWFAGVLVSIQTSITAAALSAEEKVHQKALASGVTTNNVSSNVQLGLHDNLKAPNSGKPVKQGESRYPYNINNPLPDSSSGGSIIVPHGPVTRVVV